MYVAIAFTVVVLIWGSTWYAIEWQLGYVAKEWSLTYRYVIAAVLLFLWCFLKKKRLRFNRTAHTYMALTGLLLFSGNYVLVYWGTQYLTSGLVAVTFSLLTFLNIINARIFLGNRIQIRTVLAALLGVAGLTLVFKPEIQTFDLADQTFFGLLLCLGSTVLASLGNTLVGSQEVSKLPLLPFNAWGMAYGTLFNLMFALLQGEAPSLDPRPEYYIALIYLSVFGTVIAFSLMIWLLGEIGVARAGYMAVLTPLVALTISTLFEGYTWSLFAFSGLALVLLGNIFMVLSRGKK